MCQPTMSESRLTACLYGSVGIEKDEARDCHAVGDSGIVVVDISQCAALASDHEINNIDNDIPKLTGTTCSTL